MRKEIESGTADWYYNKSGVMSNCGMRQLTGFSFIVKPKGAEPGVWGITPLLEGAALEKAFEQCMPDIIKEFCGSEQSAMFVMSDRVMEVEGKVEDITKTTNRLRTAHFMRYLVANKIGNITLSPVVRNRSYSAGAHDIQTLVWIPPGAESEIVTQGKLIAPEVVSTVKDRETKELTYNSWVDRGIVWPST